MFLSDSFECSCIHELCLPKRKSNPIFYPLLQVNESCKMFLNEYSYCNCSISFNPSIDLYMYVCIFHRWRETPTAARNVHQSAEMARATCNTKIRSDKMFVQQHQHRLVNDSILDGRNCYIYSISILFYAHCVHTSTDNFFYVCLLLLPMLQCLIPRTLKSLDAMLDVYLRLHTFRDGKIRSDFFFLLAPTYCQFLGESIYLCVPEYITHKFSLFPLELSKQSNINQFQKINKRNNNPQKMYISSTHTQ